jgi:pimeloyl-ACP methyl ester carboxylesterase
LARFRADAIVADAELVRAELGVERWSVLGQSFGGFCALTYLSFAPGALREVLFTGGLPALGPRIDEVYAATYERMRERSRRYYERYPEDRAKVLALLDRLAREPLQLPGGEHLHELDPSSPAFLHDVQAASPFARNPLYAILHEACWADTGATCWSAERLLAEQSDWAPELFTGEHVFPWMFEDIAQLAPLRDAAHLLAEREWPALYDPAQLQVNEVPAAAVVYAEDVYVERRFSEETAAQVRGLRVWLTNEYEHEGLRHDGERVLGRLLDLTRGRA